MKLKILDCTLRDGGYINNWHFGNRNISMICQRLALAGTDIIEMGFLTDNVVGNGYSLYNNTEQLDKFAPNCPKGTRIAAMIALGEKEMDPIALPPASETHLDIVRLTFHNEDTEIERAMKYARCLMYKGYDVCMQHGP